MILLLLAITYHPAFEIGITPMDRMHVYLPEFWSEVAGNKVQGYCDMEAMVDLGHVSIGGGMMSIYQVESKIRGLENDYWGIKREVDVIENRINSKLENLIASNNSNHNYEIENIKKENSELRERIEILEQKLLKGEG